MNKRLLVASALVGGIVTAVTAQTPSPRFDDIPDNHWAFEAMRTFTKEGLVGQWFPNGLGYPRAFSRADFAIRTRFCFNMLADICDEIERSSKAVTASRPGSSASRALQSLNGDLGVFKDAGLWRKQMEHLIKEFSPELTACGENPLEMSRRLEATIARYERFKMPVAGSAIEQFADVPAGHWAAKATLDLRRAGILVGYPDGRFKVQ